MKEIEWLLLAQAMMEAQRAKEGKRKNEKA